MKYNIIKMEYNIQDIETIHQKFDKIIKNRDFVEDEILTNDKKNSYKEFINYCINTNDEITNLSKLKLQYKISEKNSSILKYARKLIDTNIIKPEDLINLENKLRIKRGKSHSGVLVVTIFTSSYPSYFTTKGDFKSQSFSCKWNCHYCPDQPGQPRSYLEGEPGVLRANANNFDCCKQMWSRMETLYNTGHPVDKLEVLVLGGTWDSYPYGYKKDFIRDMYYAANTFWEDNEYRRPKASLDTERDVNRNAVCKIIGLTLETRPDTINEKSIIELREFGCTRVQLGIQHIDNDVLNKINRQCPIEKTVKAIELLKDWGYKIDGHWMPNLPGSNPSKDWHMFIECLLKQTKDVEYIKPIVSGVYDWSIYSLYSEDLQLDQWKIYPCEIVPYTKIEEWYKSGEFKPYDEKELENILLETKRIMFPWIRLNRIIRDIPTDYIIASGDHPNMRQTLGNKMKKKGWKCKCIRCREIKLRVIDEVIFRVREYRSSNGTEFFISAEDATGDLLCGFLRLRHSDKQDISWIRELHVYGFIQRTCNNTINSNNTSQHRGIGKMLLEIAKNISIHFNKKKIKIISGEGVKNYYKNIGYTEGEYGYMEINI